MARQTTTEPPRYCRHLTKGTIYMYDAQKVAEGTCRECDAKGNLQFGKPIPKLPKPEDDPNTVVGLNRPTVVPADDDDGRVDMTPGRAPEDILGEKTNKQLQTLCKAFGVKLKPGANKATMVALLIERQNQMRDALAGDVPESETTIVAEAPAASTATAPAADPPTTVTTTTATAQEPNPDAGERSSEPGTHNAE